MFNIRSAALIAVLLTAACGDGSAPPPKAPKASRPEDNPYHQKLLALRPVDRMLALRRAIQDDGGSCNKVTRSEYQQEYKGMSMWIAYCSSGLWGVYLAPSGDVQARACKDAAATGLPACVVAPQTAATETVWPANARPLPPTPEPAR